MVASRRKQGSPAVDDNLNLHGFFTGTARLVLCNFSQ